MKSFTLLSLVGSVSAHFYLNTPAWRESSLDDAADAKNYSQWDHPCAGVPELPADHPNRQPWPVTGGSLNLSVGHEWALTFVNLGIGTNVSSFNVSLLNNFNQTGEGQFCIKELNRAALEEGAKAMGLGSAQDLDGMHGSLQVIQLSHGGQSLYNCADITFRANATTLSDEQCKNSTGVGGVPYANVQEGGASQTGSSAEAQPTGAAGMLKPAAVLAGLVAVGAALL